jgi:flagellin
MAGRINTNTDANFSRRLLELNNKDTSDALKRIASGLRINTASDDAAGFGISERLRSLANGFEQSEANIQDSASAIQVAEGGLTAISDGLQRLRDLSVQAANDSLTDEDRAVIQEEVDQLVAEIDRQTSATQFNGQPLLTGDYASGTGEFTVQTGPEEGDTLAVNIEKTDAASLGVNGLDISTRAAAENAISTIDSAIQAVSSQRGTLGATLNRLDNATNFTGIARENILSALSQIRDADLAKEATGLALSQIKTQSNLSALSQANLNPQNTLKLLGV